MSEEGAWSDDKLGRREEADNLRAFLSSRLVERRGRGAGASYVLNIDSSWGHGKTYFLKNIKKDLQASGCAVALVDAWATDFSDDPLTAIMSAVDSSLQPYLKTKAAKEIWTNVLKSGGTLAISLAKHTSKALASRYAGEFGDDLADALMGEAGSPKLVQAKERESDALGLGGAAAEVVDQLADSAMTKLIASFRKQEKSIAAFKNQLTRVAHSLSLERSDGCSIYILIDELDRCRPTYAIRLLESVKHLFQTDGVTFLIATDSGQLCESIRAVYGDNFESRVYLRRFFDRTYRLREPEMSAFVEFLFDRFSLSGATLNYPSGYTAPGFAAVIFSDFGFTLRDVEQCCDMLHTFCTMWRASAKVELGYALMLVCLYHAGRLEDFKVVAGQSNERLKLPIFQKQTVILKNVVGNYRDKPQTHTGTTSDLAESYIGATQRDLLHWSEQSIPNNPVTAYIISAMRDEFESQHQNRYDSRKPPLSLLSTYYRFVELAERFADSEKGLEQPQTAT